MMASELAKQILEDIEANGDMPVRIIHGADGSSQDCDAPRVLPLDLEDEEAPNCSKALCFYWYA